MHEVLHQLLDWADPFGHYNLITVLIIPVILSIVFGTLSVIVHGVVWLWCRWRKQPVPGWFKLNA